MFAEDQVVGFTCSSFDLLHAGHVLMLEEARSQCDFLIVGLQTDPTVDRPTKSRPVQTVFERFVQLKGCKYVDLIVPYTTEAELLTILSSYPIKVRIVGADYIGREFTGSNIPGITNYFNTRNHMFSSTELRGRISTKQGQA
jgi:glycerol-3-phosphate cytidylyltransferase